MYQRASVGQAGVAGLVEEQRLAALPQRLVGVHARAVVLEHRLGHERERLAGLQATFFSTYLNVMSWSAMARQGVELRADLALAAGGDLVVVQLDLDAQLHERGGHLRAQVLVVVHRRHREVALLGAGLVAQVGPLVAAGVPDALDRVDHVEGLVRPVLEADVVEDEELGLGAEVGGVGDAGRLHVLLGLLGDVARVTAVALDRERVGDEAVEHQRLAGPERIDVGRRRVREQDHVRLLDLLEPPDRRAVEAVPVLEGAPRSAPRRGW